MRETLLHAVRKGRKHPALAMGQELLKPDNVHPLWREQVGLSSMEEAMGKRSVTCPCGGLLCSRLCSVEELSGPAQDTCLLLPRHVAWEAVWALLCVLSVHSESRGLPLRFPFGEKANYHHQQQQQQKGEIYLAILMLIATPVELSTFCGQSKAQWRHDIWKLLGLVL